jgi:hypothetical protein
VGAGSKEHTAHGEETDSVSPRIRKPKRVAYYPTNTQPDELAGPLTSPAQRRNALSLSVKQENLVFS